jgi:hypothetical protein
MLHLRNKKTILIKHCVGMSSMRYLWGLRKRSSKRLGSATHSLKHLRNYWKNIYFHIQIQSNGRNLEINTYGQWKLMILLRQIWMVWSKSTLVTLSLVRSTCQTRTH